LIEELTGTDKLILIFTILSFFGIVATLYVSVGGPIPGRPPEPEPPSPYTYFAPVPGQKCDTGHATWLTAPDTQIECLSDRMLLTAKSADTLGQELFFGTQRLPTNNQVDVYISGISAGACAGVLTRNSNTRKGGYAFAICADGAWAIDIYSDSDVANPLAIGRVTPSPAYHLEVTTQGLFLTLAIDRDRPTVTKEGSFTDTNSIGLFVSLDPTSADETTAGRLSAAFSDFTFTQTASF
jgi:hypothetical protein